MRYEIGKNINVVKARLEDVNMLLCFQKEVINDMENKEFFAPLTKKEFTDPIQNGFVGILYFNNKMIGLFVLTIPYKEVIDEYQLEDNNDVGIFDSIMIKNEYRGSKLQQQSLDYAEMIAKTLNLKRIVATVHPDNVWSLNNFLDKDYKIINKKNIHGGARYIIQKTLRTKS